MWAHGPCGTQVPVEWQVRGGAIVNVDHPLVAPYGEGSQVPHVGYQGVGIRVKGGLVRGHILLDDVPATRPSRAVKKCGGK
jgi:hypothetical protein